MKNSKNRLSGRFVGPIVAAVLVLAAGFVLLFFNGTWTAGWYQIINDPERLRDYVGRWGLAGGPLAFIGIQILQVVLAPFPGEASGFAGGYLFGIVSGFIYSSVGLTIGSLINFALGRTLGRHYVAKWIPERHMERFDRLAKRQGVIVFFLFFVFPGFPKDYLCLFLGFTSLSVKVFTFLTAIGRVPGTFMLSLQGAQVFEGDYLTLLILAALCLAVVIPVYLWRERLYGWVERLNETAKAESETTKDP